MKKTSIHRHLFTPALVALGLSLSSASVWASDKDLAEARQLVQQFAQQLQPALGQAMRSGGPVEAIDVCKVKAPEIAQNLSQTSGWEVNRVSLKNRAESAKPDLWEATALQKFELQLAAGEAPETLEHYGIVQQGGEIKYRYMRAVVIGADQPCLHCHGTDIQTPVKQKILEAYPHDKAVGYQTGQVRGAFSFSKPL